MKEQVSFAAVPAEKSAETQNGKPKKKKFNRTYLFCWIGAGIPLLGFLLFSGFPLVISILAMFSDMKYNKIETMVWNDFAHFARFFTDPKLLQAIKVTLILACAQFVSLAIALLMAAFLSQNVKGTRLFQTLYFVPYICSTVAVSIMWNNIFGIEGVINTILGLDINWYNNLDNPYTLTLAIFISIIWQAPGYGIVMYCSSFEAISPSLYEAADLDGANAVQKFRYITLPGISSITFFLLLAGILAGLTTFDAAKIMAPADWDGNAGLNNAGLTVMYYIYIEGMQFSNMGYASVMSWMLFIIMMIPSVFLIKKRILEVEDM